MDEGNGFQFSLRNIFLMMLPLAVLFAGMAHQAGMILSGGIVLVSAAVGALLGGWDGMGRGIVWSIVWTLVCSVVILIVWFLALFAIVTIRHFCG